jgi:hypothetical protein
LAAIRYGNLNELEDKRVNRASETIPMLKKRKAGPLLAAFGLLGTLLYIAFYRIHHLFGPQVQIFTLDDTYISAGIAKHLLLDHNWGVSPDSFSSASSSILWPILLAGGFAVFGVHIWVAFALNILLAFMLLWLCWHILSTELPNAPARIVFLTLACIVIATPLPMMVFLSMEHTAFSVAAVAFMYCGGSYLAQSHPDGQRPLHLLLLAFTAMLACSLRYEGMFQVAVVCGLLLLQKQIRAVLVVSLAAALPIVVFGIFSLRYGGHFFPNSLLQKVGPPTRILSSIHVFVRDQGLLSSYSVHNGLFVLWLASAILLLFALRDARSGASRISLRSRYLLAIFAVSTLLHCQFSHLNWLWRYESYLMAAGILFIAIALVQTATNKLSDKPTTRWRLRLATLGAAVIVLAVTPRAWNSFTDIPHSANAIFEQQYQTGMFLARYYYGAHVVLNDIGVPNYKSNAHVLDLTGLGSISVTELQAQHRFDTAAIAKLAADDHSRIAILYRRWFVGETAPPASWTEVGSWTIRPMDPRVPIADHTFTFFAVTPADVDYLHRSLCANRALVPKDEIKRTVLPCEDEASPAGAPAAR